MGQQEYLIDTNIAIASLGNALSSPAIEFVNTISPAISVISQIELLGWFHVSPADLISLQNFVSKATIFPLETRIIEQSITLRQHYKIKTPDAIIAATALVFDLILLTRNLSDFKQIPSLKLVNPFDL